MYLTLSSLGLSDGCSILDIINALPAKSVFLYHEQYNGATINDMPPNYRNGGIIKILNIGGRYEIDFRRQNANSLLSPPEHYVGSVAGSNPATIEWSKNLTNADIDGRLFFSASGTTAIESFDNASNRYRLQVGTAGTVRLYHSSDGGKTWPNFKEIAFTS